ncbi:MAG: transcription elongation factor GreB [Alphaproteobacteria bacterium]|nr:transcription elongation factor GreB [Alphaproteobacteria bacterium]
MDDDDHDGPRLPPGTKNYMTPSGHARLVAEFNQLARVERPQIVEIVSWAAGNGDRSENGDYLYGKKRLREIDRRMRFLTKRLEIAELVDPTAQTNRDRVFFGATVTYVNGRDDVRTVTILGVDEADITRGEVSLHSPIARTLLRRGLGETARLQTPVGIEEIEIITITYPTA